MGSLSAFPLASCSVVHLVYLDASNILLSGSHVSAARQGKADSPQAANDAGIFDFAFRIHFARLLDFAVGEGREGLAVRAVAFGSVAADATVEWGGAAKFHGWEPRVSRRSRFGSEKEVDTGISVMMTADAIRSAASGARVDVTLISGDRDNSPALVELAQLGIGVDVLSWEHSLSSKLKSLARRVVLLDEQFEYLRYVPTKR